MIRSMQWSAVFTGRGSRGLGGYGARVILTRFGVGLQVRSCPDGGPLPNRLPQFCQQREVEDLTFIWISETRRIVNKKRKINFTSILNFSFGRV